MNPRPLLLRAAHPKGGDPDEWPHPYRREFPGDRP